MPMTAGMASKPGTPAALVETFVVGGLPVAEADENGSCASTCVAGQSLTSRQFCILFDNDPSLRVRENNQWRLAIII